MASGLYPFLTKRIFFFTLILKRVLVHSKPFFSYWHLLMRSRILETKTSGEMKVGSIKAKEGLFPFVVLMFSNLEAWERSRPRNRLVLGIGCGIGLSLCSEMTSKRLEMRRALPTREAEEWAEWDHSPRWSPPQLQNHGRTAHPFYCFSGLCYIMECASWILDLTLHFDQMDPPSMATQTRCT